MLSINFRVNLKPINTGLLTDAESLHVANTMDIFIPGLLGGENILRSHGEIFTLTGQRAIYLKNLIEKNNITNIEVYTGPIEEVEINSIEDVEYLDLYSLGSNTFANWQTSEYMTDIQVKINDNEWISLNTFDIGIGESEI